MASTTTNSRTATKAAEQAADTSAAEEHYGAMAREARELVEFDENDPRVQADAIADAIGYPADRAPVVLRDAISTFAEGVGLIERLARMGDAELVTELARIAYARGRRLERDGGRA